MDWPGHIAKDIMDTYLHELKLSIDEIDILDVNTWNWLHSSIYWNILNDKQREIWWMYRAVSGLV